MTTQSAIAVELQEGADVQAHAAQRIQVSVLLPAFNEERAVGQVVREVLAALATWPDQWEVVVVDDASSDDTARQAERAGARVVRRPERGGYGAALKTGLRAVSGSWIAILDADGTYDAAALPALLRELPAYDLVNGVRSGDFGRLAGVRTAAKAILTKLAAWISGKHIIDLNTGMKVFKLEPALSSLWALPEGFSAGSSLTMAFLCNGRLVAHVPVAYRPRIGQSKFHPLHDTLRYLATIGRMLLYFRPLRVFLPLAGMMLAVAIPKAIWDMVRSPEGLHDADVILLCLAVMIAMFALLAELIVAQRRAVERT